MYVDLAGLARYKSDFDAWARGALLPKDAAAARVRTAKAGAVSFVPVQRTPLDVSVDFVFSETPPASGDKAPGNPSTITGVTQAKVTRCGKNLLKFLNYSSNTINGVTCSADSNGIITLDGTASGNASFQQYFNPKIRIDNDTTVFCSYEVVSGTYTPPVGQQIAFVVQDIATKTGNSSVYLGVNNTNVNGIQKTVPAGYAFAGSNVVAYSGASFDNLKLKAQVEFGNSKTSWESPVFFDYTIPLGNTYYGGTLDAASGVMTVSSQKVTMDGSCSYVYLGGLGNGTGFVAVVVTIPSLAVTKGYFIASRCACNKFPVFSTETPEFSKAGMFLANPNLSYFNYKQVRFYLSLDMLGLSSSATQQEVSNAAKDWFTANPVDAVFTFAEPFSTVQLSPTEILSLTQSSVYDPRVNTVYSDQQAVQVGYLKHPSAASSDLRSALVSLGGGV